MHVCGCLLMCSPVSLLFMRCTDREAYHTAMAERLRVAIGALSVRKSTVPARYIGLGNVQLGGPGRGDTKEWFDADVNPFTGVCA